MVSRIPTVASSGNEYTYDEARIEAARLNTLSLERFNAEANRVLGTSDRNTGGPQNVTRPDGTVVGNFIGSLGVTTGSATRITGGLLPQAAIFTNTIKNLIQDPTKTSSGLSSIINLFGGNSSGYNALSGGPPFTNRLEQFASYSALWTMACITPAQFNNPSSYRGNPAALTNVVFSSAGRYDGKRTATSSGVPEYFVDNVNIEASVAPIPGAGNSFSTKFQFDVIEPYSMGLFLQSLQVAAVKSGYPNYLSDCPYLFKLEIVGNTDDGSVIPTNETLTRYFTLKLTDVKMSVTESGSRYSVNAVPLHHLGVSNTVNTTYTDIALAGSNVAEVLASGERSLVNVLNTAQQELVSKGTQSVPDVYQIVFPTDASDPIGTSNPTNTELATGILGAIKDPNLDSMKRTIAGRSKIESPVIGNSPIASASMNFTAESGGNPEFKKENDLISEDGNTIQRGKMSIDIDKRTFTFPQGERITEIVQRVVLSSEYTTKALEKPDANGMYDWFRLDVQVQLLEYDPKRNTRAKKYIIRVLPFKVSSEVYKNPTAPGQGQKQREKIIAKRYDYVYTGQNNNILKFDLVFDGMFFTGAQMRATGDSKNVVNQNIQSPVDSTRGTNPVITGAAGPAVNVPTSAPVKPDQTISTRTPTGDKTPEKLVEDAFRRAYEKSSADMINLEIDIIGDPYYLSDSGINSNYFAKRGPNDQTTADESMNYEGSEIFVYLAFRTPVEPNLGVTQQGGLYDFPQAGVSPYSGVFKVTNLLHKFAGGAFTQTLKLIRMPGQGGDYNGIQNVIASNNNIYGTSIPVPPKTAPAADAPVPAKEDIAATELGEIEEPGGSAQAYSTGQLPEE